MLQPGRNGDSAEKPVGAQRARESGSAHRCHHDHPAVSCPERVSEGRGGGPPVEHFGEANARFSCLDAIRVLRAHPEWTALNRAVARKGAA